MCIHVLCVCPLPPYACLRPKTGSAPPAARPPSTTTQQPPSPPAPLPPSAPTSAPPAPEPRRRSAARRRLRPGLRFGALARGRSAAGAAPLAAPCLPGGAGPSAAGHGHVRQRCGGLCCCCCCCRCRWWGCRRWRSAAVAIRFRDAR